MNSCYKVQASCSTPGCSNTDHQEVLRTINHESSFSFAMMMNELGGPTAALKCYCCGRPLYYYPVSHMAEPIYYE